MGFFKKIFSREKKEKLDSGLQKSKEGVLGKITRAIAGKSKVDDEVLDNLEEAFITSDVGVDTTLKIINRLEERVARDKYVNTAELNKLLCEEVTDMLEKPDNGDGELEDFQIRKKENGDPYVIMVVGVNGGGKTGRQQGRARCCRHIPCRLHTAARDLGGKSRRSGSEAGNGKRSGRRGI